MFDNMEILKHFNSFYDIFHSISDLVFIMKVDEDGRFRYLFVNETAQQITKLTEESLGKTVEEVMPKDVAEAVIEQYRNAIQKKECTTYEDYKVHPAKFIKVEKQLSNTPKDFVFFESKITPLFDENGSCTHIISIVRDITDRKRKEIELNELKDRYHSLYEYNFNGVYSVDLQGCITSVNPAMEKITGYAADELIGSNITPLIVPAYLEQTYDFFQKTIKGETQEFESTFYHKNGHVIYVTVMNVPIFIDGQIAGVYGIVVDQTENIMAEKTIQESEELYRLIADNMTDLVSIMDTHAIMKYASPSYESVLGYTPRNYEGKQVFEFIHPDEIEYIHNQFREVLLTKRPKTVEVRHKHANGNWVWLEAKGSPILDEEKNLIHILVVAREITERKSFEEKLSYMAYHDTLTDLPNRRLFKHKLEQSIEEATRCGRKIAVMFMDIDNFKKTNDTLGHDIGDELLIQFSKKVKGILGNFDTLARYGGDEFCALLEINQDQDIHFLAKKMIDSFQTKWIIGPHEFVTTSSIGVAIFEEGFNSDTLIKAADIALYQAKEKGKNNYQIYESKLINTM